MTNRILTILSIAVLAWFIAVPAWATATRCNNTYNTDITDEGNTILYFFCDWGSGKYDDGHFFGISYGLMDWVEIGGTYRLTENSDFQSDPFFDIKVRYGFSNCDDPDSDWGHSGAIAFGLDNITGNEDENGSMIPYIAYTHLWSGDFRGHAGYSLEDNNTGLFFGFDTVAGDANLKWDWMQTNDGSDWITAFGFDIPVTIFDTDLGFCTFLTFPSNDNESEVWYVEFTYEFD